MKKIYFKKFGGEKVEDEVQYILDYIKRDPGNELLGKSSNIQISIGCDSAIKRRRSIYAITIVFYDNMQKNGAHYIFKRIKIPKSFLLKGKRFSQWEIEKVSDLEYASVQNKITPDVLKSLTFNRLWNEVEYIKELGIHLDAALKGHYFVKHKPNSDGSAPWRLPVLHIDLNPEFGDGHNRSFTVYQAAVGYLIGEGFKVVYKPLAYASSSAADLLCQ